LFWECHNKLNTPSKKTQIPKGKKNPRSRPILRKGFGGGGVGARTWLEIVGAYDVLKLK